MWFIFLLQLLVLGLAGFVGCWAAQRVGLPRIVGGVLAGMLLGPMVLGEISPGAYHYLFAGRYQLFELEQEFLNERHAAREVLEATGVTPVALVEFDAQTRAELRQMRIDADVREGPSTPQRVTRALTFAAGAAVLAAVGLAAPLRRFRRDVIEPLPTALGSAITAGVLAACLGWLLIYFRWVEPARPSLWLAGMAAGCAVAAAPIARRLIERLNFDYQSPPPEPPVNGTLPVARHAWNAAALSVLLAMLAVVVLAAWPVVERSEQWVSRIVPLGYAAGALIVLIASMVVAALALQGPPRPRRKPGGAWSGLFGVGEPLLLAIAGLHLNFTLGFSWLLLLAAWLAFGDGKALGGVLGARLIAGRPWPEAWQIGVLLAPGGATTLLVALLLRQAQVIDHELYAALVLAAVIAALLAGPELSLMMRWADDAAGHSADPPRADSNSA